MTAPSNLLQLLDQPPSLLTKVKALASYHELGLGVGTVLANTHASHEGASPDVTPLLDAGGAQLGERLDLAFLVLELALFLVPGPLPDRGLVGVGPRVGNVLGLARGAGGEEGQDVLDVGGLDKVRDHEEGGRGLLGVRRVALSGGRLRVDVLWVVEELSEEFGVQPGNLEGLLGRGVLEWSIHVAHHTLHHSGSVGRYAFGAIDVMSVC
jgi:hypothetical protein